jgi:hypothetical protein
MEPQASPEAESSVPDPEVHSRLCQICNHPQRQEIDEEFVYWGHPGTIVKKFGLRHRATLYRHARALKLYLARSWNLRSALEHLIERASITKVTADSIVRAVQTYAHISPHGKWEEPLRKVMAVKEEEQSKEVKFVVSQDLYDIIEERKRRRDADIAKLNLQTNPVIYPDATQQQNRHP